MLKLRRIISSESWIPEIDGLRFAAILAVLLFHITGEVKERGAAPLHLNLPHLLYLTGNGDRGVALFFVISGFVLARPFYAQYRSQGRPVRLPQYFLRRITRLEPPFLLSLALYFLAFAFVMHEPLANLTHHTLASAAYLHNVIYPGVLPFPSFVTWSLEVEVQFYLLAPLIGQIYRIPGRAPRRLVWLALMIGGCIWSYLHWQPPVTLLTYAGFFPAGFLLADLFDDPQRPQTQSYLWDVFGLLGWVSVFALPLTPATRGFLPLIIVPLYLTVFHGKVQRRIFRMSFLTTIGGMCYSLYLTHMLVLSVAMRGLKRLHFPSDTALFFVETLVMLAIVIPFGTVYFVLIERPCMNKRWPQELLGWFRRLRSAEPQHT